MFECISECISELEMYDVILALIIVILVWLMFSSRGTQEGFDANPNDSQVAQIRSLQQAIKRDEAFIQSMSEWMAKHADKMVQNPNLRETANQRLTNVTQRLQDNKRRLVDLSNAARDTEHGTARDTEHGTARDTAHDAAPTQQVDEPATAAIPATPATPATNPAARGLPLNPSISSAQNAARQTVHASTQASDADLDEIDKMVEMAVAKIAREVMGSVDNVEWDKVAEAAGNAVENTIKEYGRAYRAMNKEQLADALGTEAGRSAKGIAQNLRTGVAQVNNNV